MKVGDLVSIKVNPLRLRVFDGQDLDDPYFGIILKWNKNARVARVLLGDKGDGVLIHAEDLEVVNESR